VEFTYEIPGAGPPTWWNSWGRYLFFGVGLAASAVIGIFAPATIPALLWAVGTTAAALAVGGAISGYRSWRGGNGFWAGFGDYVMDNVVSAFAAAFTIHAITSGLGLLFSRIANRQCFAAGTLVLCRDENGNETHKKIEDVEAGDLVLAYDEETGTSDWKEVVRLFRGETSEWYRVKVDGERIACTAEHPFFVVGKGFVPAKCLEAGDNCLLASGKYGIISAVEAERLDTPEATYNFEVADYHTYYVGEQGVCVHNTCYLDPKDIQYTQNSISNTFGERTAHAGESVDDLIDALKAGAVTPDDIPPLKVFEQNGKIWSINNRRLFAYKMAGVEGVPVKLVNVSSMTHGWTGNGIDIIVNGGSRYI
jgi:hypothetical protein